MIGGGSAPSRRRRSVTCLAVLVLPSSPRPEVDRDNRDLWSAYSYVDRAPGGRRTCSLGPLVAISTFCCWTHDGSLR